MEKSTHSSVLGFSTQQICNVSIHYVDFPGGSLGKVRSPGDGKVYPLQCSCLEIPWTKEPDSLHDCNDYHFHCHLFIMQSVMNLKTLFVTKAYATLITFVRFISSMNELMPDEGSSTAEHLTTLITFVRFLSSMNSLMNYEV